MGFRNVKNRLDLIKLNNKKILLFISYFFNIYVYILM